MTDEKNDIATERTIGGGWRWVIVGEYRVVQCLRRGSFCFGVETLRGMENSGAN